MGLAQDCDDLRNGYVTHRELNERDGLFDNWTEDWENWDDDSDSVEEEEE